MDLINKKVGKLTILSIVENTYPKKILVICDCGNQKEMYLSNLKEGNTISCGCERRIKARDRLTIHGLTKHPLFDIWYGMIKRCNDKSNKDYGGRGISVNKKWESDFLIFYKWAISNGWKRGLDLDREDNDGNYSEENCRFVIRKLSQRNRRNTVYYTLNNEKKSLAEWCEIYRLNLDYVRHRIRKYGYSLEYFINKNKYIGIK